MTAVLNILFDVMTTDCKKKCYKKRNLKWECLHFYEHVLLKNIMLFLNLANLFFC